MKEAHSQKKPPLKNVVITGGATGIGLETAKRLLETQLYRVIIIARNDEHMESASAALKGLGEYSGYLCDLADENQIKKTCEKIIATHKTIYGLVNNAGIYPFGGITNTTAEAWDHTMNVNLKAPFLLCQALVPVISKNTDGGRIVNLSSTAGILPNHFALAYSVSKAALLQLTRTLAKEVGKNGITVNCICPGIVRSPLHEEYHASRKELEEFYAKRGSAFPLGRVGEPSDIAGAVRFFLSDDAAWVTGDVFIVDGGRLLL